MSQVRASPTKRDRRILKTLSSKRNTPSVVRGYGHRTGMYNYCEVGAVVAKEKAEDRSNIR